MNERLTHVDDAGRARMVDTSSKNVTLRSATARGSVTCSDEAMRQVRANSVTKGNVIEVARLAGIMAAKRTPDLIPLCHPLPLRHVDVLIDADSTEGSILIEATARVEAATGVEMEALTAVAVAGLTIIDMIKAIDRWARIADVALVSKEGGKSGLQRREDAQAPEG